MVMHDVRQKKNVKIIVRVLIVVIGLLLLVRIILPVVLIKIANDQIEQIPGYTGKIKDIDLHLFKGNYSLKEISLVWLNGPAGKNETVFRTERIFVKLLWKELFKGRIVGSSAVIIPEVNVFEKMLVPKTKKGKPPTVIFRNILPVKLNEVRIRNGELHFKNYTKSPNFDFFIKECNASLLNLTNMQNRKDPTFATLTVNGTVMGSGSLRMEASINPVSDYPEFKVKLFLSGMDLRSINNLARYYTSLDFEKGTLSMTSEISVKNGSIDGFVRPVFQNMQIFTWSEDLKERKNILKDFWEALSGATSETLENRSDQLSATIPVSGKLEDPNVDVATALVTVLRNIFTTAVFPDLKTLKPQKNQ